MAARYHINGHLYWTNVLQNDIPTAISPGYNGAVTDGLQRHSGSSSGMEGNYYEAGFLTVFLFFE